MGVIQERDLGISFSAEDNELMSEADDMVLHVGTVINENPKMKFVIGFSGRDENTDNFAKMTMSFTREQFKSFAEGFEKFVKANLVSEEPLTEGEARSNVKRYQAESVPPVKPPNGPKRDA